jgi:hypothetical protein
MPTSTSNAHRLAAFSAAALMLAACGGSSPNPTATNASGPPLGYMSVAFTVAATVNFAKYRYQIVFNTTGNGLTPEAGGNAGGKSSLAAYSYALEVGGSGGGTVGAWEYLRPSNCPTCAPAYVALLTTPSQLALVSSGAASEFTVLLKRSIFTNAAPTWLFNAFTTQNKTGAVIDSMGTCATCFVSPELLVSEAFQKTIFAGSGTPTGDPAARIVSIQITNEP